MINLFEYTITDSRGKDMLVESGAASIRKKKSKRKQAKNILQPRWKLVKTPGTQYERSLMQNQKL